MRRAHAQFSFIASIDACIVVVILITPLSGASHTE
jgi:hypothetical protein